MIKNLNLFFLTCLVMGVTMTLSSNNWLSSWMGLEVSLLSFLPIMLNNSKLNSESCIKYFIIQSLSSVIMMMGVIMMTITKIKFLLLMSLSMKLGLFPFHLWILSMIEGLNLNSLFIMSTLMKLGPMNLMSYMENNMFTITVTSMVTTSIAGLMQNSLKKIITYSSIYNLSLMMCSINNYLIWTLMLIMYSASLMIFILMIKNLSMTYLNQIMFNNTDFIEKLWIWLNLMNMGGMPPMLLFFSKLILMIYLISMKYYIMVTIMILSSLMVMFMYFRMSFLSMLLFSIINPWILNNSTMMNFQLTLMIMLCPMILFNLKSF